MPFFGLLKQEILGKQPIESLNSQTTDYVVNLTRDIIEIVGKEVKSVDFWENYTKQKQLKSYLISHLLAKISPHQDLSQKYIMTKEEFERFKVGMKETAYRKRNEIAQKVMELAYHIYGKKKN